MIGLLIGTFLGLFLFGVMIYAIVHSLTTEITDPEVLRRLHPDKE